MDKSNSLKLKICLHFYLGFMVKKASSPEYIKSKSAQQGSLLFKTQALLYCKNQILILILIQFTRVFLIDSQEDSN